jgi:integrase
MAWVFKRPGRKTWYMAYYSHTEAGRKKIIRSCDTEDHTSAMSLAAEIGEIKRGQVRQERVQMLLQEAGAKVDIQGRYPVKELWEYYKQQPSVRTITERTMDSKENNARAFIKWLGENHPEIKYIDEISEKTAAAFMKSISDRSGVTRNNYLSNLKSVFASIRIPLGLGNNVWGAVQRVEARSIRKGDLTIKQIQTLHAKSKEYTSRYLGFWPVAISLAYHVGMRLGDVCTLSWNELDFKHSMIQYIPNKTKKKGKTLSYPFSPEWSKPLKELWKGETSGPVWPEVEKDYLGRSRFLMEEFEGICGKAEIKTTREKNEGEKRVNAVKMIGFHSLRHSHVTMALEGGASLTDVQNTVGHGSPAMTEHYNHSLAAGKRVAQKLPGLRK